MEEGKYYHIYNRGNNKETIFKEEDNYYYFLKKYEYYLSEVVDTYAYCLMPNHFHFLVRIKEPTTSSKAPSESSIEQKIKTLKPTLLTPVEKAFKDFFISYAKSINKKYKRTGSLFQYKFKRKEIDSIWYLRKLTRYIHYNPVEAGLCNNLYDWKFSSYQKILSNQPEMNLTKDEIFEWFGDKESFLFYHENQQEPEQNAKRPSRAPLAPQLTSKVFKTFEVRAEPSAGTRTFKQTFDNYNWEEVKKSIYEKTSADVEHALGKTKRDLEDFKALISPAALPYLERMAKLSQQLTQKRFGKTIQMYIPLYLSNECQNICSYCGFSLHNKIKRITLNDEQIIKEIEVIKSYGYDHVLLVTGESSMVNIDYFAHAIRLIRKYFSQISIEVQPLEQREYEILRNEGITSVLVYQETYHKEDYKKHHIKGKKANFYYRLETPDRLGAAGIHKIGIGVLLGLEDWRTDSFFTALHLNYLEKKYWQTNYSLSFPRLRPAEGVSGPKIEMNDKELVQLICAYRIFNEELELSISTRESRKFRDNIIKLGATTMSAGSKTNPGGYSAEKNSLEQFEIDDDRAPLEISQIVKRQGYEPLWKNWDKAYTKQES